MKNLFTILVGLFMAVSAEAGVGAHGGNVVICNGQPAVTLDYYNASLPTMEGPHAITNLSSMSAQQVMDLVRSRFNGSLFMGVFDEAVAKLLPSNKWIVSDLKQVDDSNEPYFLPPTCKRVTAAVRQDTTIYVDPTVFSQLSDAQKGLLMIHEVLYYISGEDSSTPVREALRLLLEPSPTQAQIMEAVHALKSPYLGHEFVVGNIFYPEGPNYGVVTSLMSIYTGTQADSISVMIDTYNYFFLRTGINTYDGQVQVNYTYTPCRLEVLTSKRVSLTCEGSPVLFLNRN